mmetsp:Transcript_88823/g.157410  ORF Transcript_88823/g.157410 Transcript_88823/m.157410 type:complete len:326 (+) Transcript_88823:60-1037(+)
MCGRGALTLSADRCQRVAGSARRDVRLRGTARLRTKYNLGPQSYVPVIRTAHDGNTNCSSDREVCAMRWGLVPSFAKRSEDYDVFKGGSTTFNARVEGAESSNLWRRLLDRSRGVVLFDGFYEWKAVGKSKVPMYIRNRDEYDGHSIPWPSEPEVEEEASKHRSGEQESPAQAPLLLAGLFDCWQSQKDSSDSETVDSVTILTMDPSCTPMENVHDRMPVFLTPDTAALWLDETKPFATIIQLVLKASKAHAASQLLFYEVSPLVSNIRNETPDCIIPRKEYDAKQLSKGIGRFFKKKEDATTAGEKRKAEVLHEAADARVICLD